MHFFWHWWMNLSRHLLFLRVKKKIKKKKKISNNYIRLLKSLTTSLTLLSSADTFSSSKPIPMASPPTPTAPPK